MISSLLICLALLCIFPSEAINSHKNGYYYGRSADIVIEDEHKPVELQLEWQKSVLEVGGHRSNVTDLTDVQVYNLISRALVLPQIELPRGVINVELEDTVPVDFWSSPLGNTLFSFAGVSADMLPSSTRILGRTPVYSLQQTSTPYTPIASLATAITGTQPRRHGVVNTGSTDATVANLFDVVKGLYPGKESIVVAGSSCCKYAKVLSPHKDTDSYSWDSEKGSFESLDSSEPTIVVSRENIITHLSALGYSKSLSYDGVSGVGSIGDVTFTKADESLFAEVAFVAAWSSRLEEVESSVVRKFFSFHFTSLAQILKQYQVGSPQWLAAVDLIDYTVFSAIRSDSAFQMIYLPSLLTDNSEELSALIAPLVSGLTVEGETFPQIFLNKRGKAKLRDLCHSIRSVVAKKYSHVTVSCSEIFHQNNQKRNDDPIVQPVPIQASGKTVLTFHYVFWTMLVLVFAVIWATCAIATIEPDQGLYQASTYFKK